MINNNIQESYCSFEVSKLLKEKGFEVLSKSGYDLKGEIHKKTNNMSRKVTVEAKVKLVINLEEGETVDEAIQEMDYDFSYSPDNAENRIIDTSIS